MSNEICQEYISARWEYEHACLMNRYGISPDNMSCFFEAAKQRYHKAYLAFQEYRIKELGLEKFCKGEDL